MIYLLAAALGLHGIVHVLGFMSTWHIGNGTAVMSPTLLAGLDPDAPLLRAIGVIWLVLLVAFVAAAAGLAFDAPWWSPSRLQQRCSPCSCAWRGGTTRRSASR